MKLLIVLLIVANGYADKLDRTYLPPVNAASSGGSSSTLTAPGTKFDINVPLGSGAQFGNSFGQELLSASGRQPALSAGQIGSSTYGGAPENFQSEPKYGLGNGQGQSRPSGIGSSGIGSFNGRPFTPSADALPGQTFSPKYNEGDQQSLKAQSSGPIGQAAEQEGQGFNVAQAYKPERAQAAADRNAEILKYINDNNGGVYTFSYETSNGISAEESGTATDGVKAQGGFAYTGDDGNAYSLTYTADENGFQPQGDHLPTPHPIPEEILKSIEDNAKAAAAGTQEGSYRPEEYESDKEEYNAGISSYNLPQGQSEGSKQGSNSIQGLDITQAQSNQFAVNQGTLGSSQSNGQSGQFSPTNQVSSKPSGIRGQNNQYQQSFGNNNQGASGQLPGQASVAQGQRQGSSGYKYNQPLNSFNQATQLGLGASSLFGSGNNQGNLGSQSGKHPSSGNSVATDQQFSKGPRNQLANSIQPIGQGQQNNVNINEPSNYQESSPGYQTNSGNQGSLGTFGSSSQSYQYQDNTNRRPFGLDNGSDGKSGSISQNQQNAKQPLLGVNIGSNQGSSQLSTGYPNIGSGSQLGQANQSPFGSNRKPSQSGQLGTERPTFGLITSSQGSTGPSSIQAPYQYNRPSQSFPPQSQGPQHLNGQGAEISSSAFRVVGQPSGTPGSQGFNGQQSNGFPGYQSLNGQSPSASASGYQGTNGQQPNGASSSYPRGNGQLPGSNSPVSQGLSGQQLGGPSGYQDGNGQRAGTGASGSQGPNRQQPGDDSAGYQGGKGQHLGVSSPSQTGNAQHPGQSASGASAAGARPGGSGQGSESGSEQFGGPRQPPSFSPQEGYKY